VRLQALLEDVDVLELVGDRDVDVTSVTHESRRVAPGALFACIPGARTDGHEHAAAAVSAGAVALLVERPLALGVSEARVASTRVALGPVAARFYGTPSRAMRCLGVTGTNGKTTTTYLLESIARAAGERVGVVGTTGARVDGDPVPLDHTTPEAPDLQALLARMRDAEVALVAMEVSSHALAHHRVDGTHFAVICFTNLSHDHLDFHGDLDSYFEAKARAFTSDFADAVVTNLDDEHGRELAGRARAAGLPVVTYGVDSSDADVRATDVVLDAAGSRFVLHDGVDGTSVPVVSHLLGAFNVSNALAAAATARVAGIGSDAIVAGLAAEVVVPGRLQPVDGGQPFTVLVDYAHTPDALEQALRAARAIAGSRSADGRVLVVFGCGGDRDPEKRAPMGRVAAAGADVTIVTNDNPRSEAPETIAAEVLTGAEGGSAEVSVELDRRAAIRRALAAAAPGDVVLLAGKGHETTQTAQGRSVPFDDRVVAREELGVRSWS
jgi:UDP-N-acetylmuramoyl-L-alanyl-D-glutamate--2,6-diaminopimelate ligase